MRTVILILATIIWTLGGFLFSVLYPGFSWTQSLTFSMFLWLAVIASAVTKSTSVGFILLITAALVSVAGRLEGISPITSSRIFSSMAAGSMLGVFTYWGMAAIPEPTAKTTSAS